MTVRVAINGFGRIGRLAFRAIIESGRTDIEVVAINDLADPKSNAHLLKYDSTHKIFPATVSSTADSIIVNGKSIKVYAEKDPTKLPWGALNIDVVFECTGIFTTREKAGFHLQAGAKKVLISAPATDPDATIVMGVNNEIIKASHTIISNGSCTTNCLAPVISVLQEVCGIEHGYMTTVHSYTLDQNPLDGVHKDLRRARACALSMIPSTTGAAKALGEVIPEVKGKLDGSAIRVPTPNVSLVDLKFVPSKATTAEAINEAMKKASLNGKLKGILNYTDEELVSIDFNHNPHSSIFDATQTKVLGGGKFVRIVSWYDNEWGFSNRMSDTAVAMMNAK